MEARKQGCRAMEADSLSVDITFAPPNAQRRDIDGCLTSCKAGFDGLADVLRIDDSRWRISMTMASPVKGGAVLLELTIPNRTGDTLVLQSNAAILAHPTNRTEEFTECIPSKN